MLQAVELGEAEANLPLDTNKTLEEVISSLPSPLFHLPPSLSVNEEGVASFAPLPDMNGLEGVPFSSSFTGMEGVSSPTSSSPAVDWTHPQPPSLPGVDGVPPPPPPPLGGLTNIGIPS